MRTWKNRRHHSKPSRKTRSRKQHGGAVITLAQYRDYKKQIEALDAKNGPQNRTPELTRAMDALALIKQSKPKTNWLTSSPDMPIEVDQRYLSALDTAVTIQSTMLSPEVRSRLAAATSAPSGLALRSAAPEPGYETDEAKESDETFDDAPPALPVSDFAPPPINSAALNLENPMRSGIAPPVTPSGPPPSGVLAYKSPRTTPTSRAALGRTPAVGSQGMSVYSMTGPEGENRSVSKCEETLALLRKELEGLKSKMSTDSAKRDGEEAALNAQIEELTARKDRYKAKAKSLEETVSALTDASGADAAKAAAALQAAQRDAADMSASQQAEIDGLLADIAGKDRLTEDQQKRLAALDGQLRAAAEAASESARDASDQISRLQAAHAAELARLTGEYEGKLTAVSGDLSAARASLAEETGPKKKALSDQIDVLQATVDSQRAEIAKLGANLDSSKKSLEKSVADATAAGNAADAAAAKAAQDAATARDRLAALSAENASLTDQLAAAKAGEAAARARADAAGLSSDEATAAAAAARSAQELAEAAAAAASAEATRANAARGTSEADKARLARDADAAAAAAGEAKRRADEATAAAAAKAQELADALAGLSDAEAQLKRINESVPLIIQITGPGGVGDKVGNGGRPTQLGEKLAVTWQPGAHAPLAWVFVLFARGEPQYTQLLIGKDVEGFTFESTVAGDISATIFDVVMHSADQLLGR